MNAAGPITPPSAAARVLGDGLGAASAARPLDAASRRATDAGPRTRQREQALDGDRITAHRARLERPVVDALERTVERDEVVASLAEQRRHLGALVGDRRTLGVVLVVRRRQLGRVDDAGEAPLEVRDLVHRASPFDLDRRPQALDVVHRSAA